MSAEPSQRRAGGSSRALRVAVAAAVLAGLMLVRPWVSPHPLDAGAAAPAEPPPADTLETDSRAPASAARTAPVPAARTPVEKYESPPAADPATARLTVRILDDLGAPIEGAIVTVFTREIYAEASTGPSDPTHARVNHPTPTPASAELTYTIPAGYTPGVDVAPPPGQFYRPTMRWLDPVVGGTVHTEAVVLAKPRGSFHAVIVGAEDGLPLAGIHVSGATPVQAETAGRGWPSLVPFEEAERIATTDGDGRVDIDLARFGDGVAWLDAPGFARGYFEVTSDYPDRERPAEIALTRPGSIDLRIAGHSGDGVAEAVLTTLSECVFGPNLGGPAGVLRATADPDGVYRFERLPTRAPLTLRYRRSDGEVHERSGNVPLQPGEHLDVDWDLNASSTIHALAVDASGAPQAGVELRIYDPHRLREGSLARPEYDFERAATTDDRGTAILDDVPIGTWMIAPAPVELDPPRVDDLAVTPLATAVEVNGTAAIVNVTVPVHRGLWIAGRVTGSEPRSNVRVPVTARQLELGPATTQSRTDDEGAFVLGPLPPGRFAINVPIAWSGMIALDPVEAEAGARNVAIELRLGGKLAVRAVDPATGEALAAVTALAMQDGSSQSAPTDPQTLTWKVDRLRPGTYTITARTADGRVGIVPEVDVEGSREWRTIDVPVRPGCAIDLRVRGGPRYYHSITVLHDGQTYARLGLGSGGRQTVHVPPGPVRVRFERVELDRTTGRSTRKLLHDEAFVAELGVRREVICSAGD